MSFLIIFIETFSQPNQRAPTVPRLRCPLSQLALRTTTRARGLPPCANPGAPRVSVEDKCRDLED